ncbi:cryptochrome/photolyase family protein [Micropruina sonneratiae]|uniref:cryptochrome/photolyase family protein n=1 Tax=Micropruina sonneratiae TaxID=2986940 RepID=UPI002227A864|nr:deoxyribodipyrimidine photo-lyase [Micropruina sp. KQZ13P-5]MCW3157739.1 DNA photolyase family protein [Micropruina sp. KQZ13P-5]
MTSILWLRRDLRRGDHPALAAAAADGPVLPLFVLDPEFFDDAGPVRQAWLARTLRALDESYEGRLCLRSGRPEQVLPEVAQEFGARSVHISAETEPAGAARDERVRAALAEHDIELVATGSPYAVTPGRILNKQGNPYRVFTPFSRAWREHGWRGPSGEPAGLRFRHGEADAAVWRTLDAAASADGLPELPPAGERAALDRWHAFVEDDLDDYDTDRDRPDLDTTSRLSPYLKFGVLHPRTLLAGLPGRRPRAADRFGTELAWREFYADVLHHNPDSLWHDLRPELKAMEYSDDAAGLRAWREGRTGYPLVDAGMRQLLATGWMHNRIRMVTASFLAKDLHVWWPAGARHFLAHLIDGDLASNNHNWQWVAGTGADAAPYFRVFNPVGQGQRFDPDGHYVRRWVPELRHLAGSAVHEPWDAPDGYAHGYPERIVDHAEQRAVALQRLEAARDR